MMERREVLRALAVLAITPKWLLAQAAENQNAAPPLPAPVPWMLGLNPRTPLPKTTVSDAVASTVPSYFSAEEMATLTRLSDVLMPRTGKHPGALDAETPVFLDFLIGHSPQVRGTLYKSGLAWLDAQSKLQHKKPFSYTTDDEAGAILKPWLRTWMTDHPPTQTHADFVNIAHADIRTATTNSRQWLDAMDAKSREEHSQLYWSPIEPDIYAERATSIHTRPTPSVAAPQSTHEVRSYPR
jgi:hypothetical protein